MRGLLVVVGVGLMAGGTLAQGELRGPKVVEKQGAPTLVEKDFSGKLKRPEVPPEEAAAGLLGLDAASKEKVDAIVDARGEILDKIVVENLELVVQFYNARQAGDKKDQVSLLTEFMKKLAPLNARGKLADEIRGAIPAEKAKQFDALLSEYRKAAMDEARKEARRRDERLTDRQLEFREGLHSLGSEIKRSYERMISNRATEFDQILSQLSLRPEQDTKVRMLVADFARTHKGKASAEQKRGLFFKIMAELDADQQKRLVKLYVGK